MIEQQAAVIQHLQADLAATKTQLSTTRADLTAAISDLATTKTNLHNLDTKVSLVSTEGMRYL
jgi:hypothetical protein